MTFWTKSCSAAQNPPRVMEGPTQENAARVRVAAERDLKVAGGDHEVQIEVLAGVGGSAGDLALQGNGDGAQGGGARGDIVRGAAPTQGEEVGPEAVGDEAP